MAWIALAVGPLISMAMAAKTPKAGVGASTVQAVLAGALPELLSPAKPAGGAATSASGLTDTGDALLSTGSAIETTIAKDPADGFAVTTPQGPLSIVPVAPADADDTPTVVNDAAALIPNVWPSTDAVVRPSSRGAVSAIEVRSADAPTTFSWQIGVGPDQTLQPLVDGGVAVTDETLTDDPAARLGWDAFTDPLLINDPSVVAPSPETAIADQADDSPAFPEDADRTTLPGGEPATDEVPPDPGDGVEIAPYSDSDEEAPLPGEPGKAPKITTATPRKGNAKGLISVDPGAQSDAAAATLAQADAATAATTLALLSTPTAKDANGNPVSASLTVDGDTVRLTLTPSASAAYPITAATAVIAASTTAATVRAHKARYGISDQHAENFGPLDSRLLSGPLHVKFARIFVPWNVRANNPDFVQWLDNVAALGLQPYVTLIPSNADAPKPAKYYAAITRLMTSGRTKSVRAWGAWNEPNWSRNPTVHRPVLAARYWGVAQKAANRYCKKCTIVAGEFYGAAYADQRRYIASYMAALRETRDVPTLPKVWSLHAYHDLIHATTKYDNPTTAAFVKALGASVRYPRIWLTEQGVKLKSGSGTTRLNQSLALQRLAALDFLRLANTPGTKGRIDRVFYYSYQADRPDDPDHQFDSALVDYYGAARPAYCVLAFASHPRTCPDPPSPPAKQHQKPYRAPLQPIAPPTIEGTPQIGYTLTATPGTWSRDPDSVEYQWLRCFDESANCTEIVGATSSTYAPVDDDPFSWLVVRVHANADGDVSEATSSPVYVAFDFGWGGGIV